MEKWKPIEGYEGLYEVSSYGKVKNKNGKILKPYSSKGYMYYKLVKNKKRVGILAHRLVAEAFLPNPQNLPCVNHKDEVRDNNCIDNLEWCSYSYNNSYGTCMSRRCETLKNTSPLRKPIICIETGVMYQSISEAYRCTSIHFQNISKVLHGKREKAGGYHWKYIEE